MAAPPPMSNRLKAWRYDRIARFSVEPTGPPLVSNQITSNLLNIQIARNSTTTVRIGFGVRQGDMEKALNRGRPVNLRGLVK